MSIPQELVYAIVGTLFTCLAGLHVRLIKRCDALEKENRELYERLAKHTKGTSERDH